MAKCPGQDQRFWKPEDIFEVKCLECGAPIEFWKDDPKLKCPKCQKLITNPKLDISCAEWCKYAKECLGQIKGQESDTIDNKLIEYLREMAASEPQTIRLSLEILSYAEKIQLEEGGDPLVIKASAILSQIHKRRLQTKSGKDKENAIDGQDSSVYNILGKYEIRNEIVNHISRILIAYKSNTSIDSLEFKIISDSCHLAQLGQLIDTANRTMSKISWKTQTGQRLAREMSVRLENNNKTDKEL